MPQKKPAPLPEEKATEFAQALFEHIEGQIHFGDTKAQLTIGVNAVLMGSFAVLSKSLILALFSPLSSGLERVIAIVTILLFISISTSVLFALNAAQPVMDMMRRKSEKKAKQNLFFFGSIQALPPEEFIGQFSKQTLASANEAMLAQVHAKARIAQRKFNNTRRSIMFLYLSLFLWVTIQVLLAFQA